MTGPPLSTGDEPGRPPGGGASSRGPREACDPNEPPDPPDPNNLSLRGDAGDASGGVGGGGGGGDPVAAIGQAVSVLRRGGLVAFPTETVYGLGADATNASAVRRIFSVKGRPTDHPLIVHLASPSLLLEWCSRVPDAGWVLAEAFWPGPLTLVLPRSPGVIDEVTGGRDTVGVRVPSHPVAHHLLARFGGGIAAPSANLFGLVSPTTADHVRSDLGGAVDLILDGGASAVGIESTIVDLTAAMPEIVRPGAVSVDQLADVLGAAPAIWEGGSPSRAPGMLASHYAPRASVRLVTEESVITEAVALVETGAVIAVLAMRAIDGLPLDVIELEPVGDPAHYARWLYARLRQADRLAVDVLLAVPPPAKGIGVAVGDRLRRASAGG